MKIHEEDYILHSIMTSSHDYLLFFTNKGRVYKKKAYKIPEGSRISKGVPIVNIIELDKDEKLAAVSTLSDFASTEEYLFFVTKKGIVKRTCISDYRNIRVTGIIAVGLRDNDELLAVVKTDGSKQIVLGASNGKAIRFSETDVTVVGRTASGVRGMNVSENEEIVGISVIESERQEILVVTEKGYGKRSFAEEYRLQTRAGKGVKTLNITEKNGKLVALKTVRENEDLIITTEKGIVIRISTSQIPTTGRATQGVKLIKVQQENKVSTITLIPSQEDEEESTEN